MPCRFASSGTVATSRSASRAILALNVASNFLRDLVISVLHRLRQSRTLHTLTFGPIFGVHFSLFIDQLLRLAIDRQISAILRSCEGIKMLRAFVWTKATRPSPVANSEPANERYVKWTPKIGPNVKV